jgi:hypothetical protein
MMPSATWNKKVKKPRPQTACGLSRRAVSREREGEASRPRVNGWSYDTKVDLALIGRKKTKTAVPRQQRQQRQRLRADASHQRRTYVRKAYSRPGSSTGIRRTKTLSRRPSALSARDAYERLPSEDPSSFLVNRISAVTNFSIPANSSLLSSSLFQKAPASPSVPLSAALDTRCSSIKVSALARPDNAHRLRASVVASNRAAPAGQSSSPDARPAVAPLQLQNVSLDLSDSEDEEDMINLEGSEGDGAFENIYKAYKLENWMPLEPDAVEVDFEPAPVRVELKQGSKDARRRELYAQFLMRKGGLKKKAAPSQAATTVSILNGHTMPARVKKIAKGSLIYSWNPRVVHSGAKSARQTFSGINQPKSVRSTAAFRSKKKHTPQRKVPRATSAVPGRRARAAQQSVSRVPHHSNKNSHSIVTSKIDSGHRSNQARAIRVRPKTAGHAATRTRAAQAAASSVTAFTQRSSRTRRTSRPSAIGENKQTSMRENVKKAFSRASARRSSISGERLSARIHEFMSSVQTYKTDSTVRKTRSRPQTSIPRRFTLPARRSSVDNHIEEYRNMMPGISAPRHAIAHINFSSRAKWATEKVAASSEDDDIHYPKTPATSRADAKRSHATCGFFIWLGEEALSRMFEFLDVSSQMRFSHTNSYWHKYIAQHPFWHVVDFTSVNAKIDRANLASFVGAYNLDRLAHLSLNGCENLNSSDVEDFLTLLPPLRSLKLSKVTKLEDSALAFIGATCPGVTFLDLSQCPKVTDKGVLEITANCKELGSLRLARLRSLSDATCIAIGKNLQKLTSLDLTWCKKLTDDAFSYIARGCPMLQRLNMRRCKEITDDSVEQIVTHCEGLEVLTLDHCSKVTDTACRIIATKGLAMKTVSFVFCVNITDTGVSYITRGLCRALEHIFLDYCPNISPSCFAQLAQRTESCMHYEFGPRALEVVTHRICTHRGSDRMKHDLSEAECMGSPSLRYCNWN